MLGAASSLREVTCSPESCRSPVSNINHLHLLESPTWSCIYTYNSCKKKKKDRCFYLKILILPFLCECQRQTLSHNMVLCQKRLSYRRISTHDGHSRISLYTATEHWVLGHFTVPNRTIIWQTCLRSLRYRGEPLNSRKEPKKAPKGHIFSFLMAQLSRCHMWVTIGICSTEV